MTNSAQYVWSCPAHPTSPVGWTSDRGVCLQCGHTNHPMDLYGIYRVLVIAGNLKEFRHYAQELFPDEVNHSAGAVRCGSTIYQYARDRQSARGHDRDRTRYVLAEGEWRADEEMVRYIQDCFRPAFPVEPPDRGMPGLNSLGDPTCRFSAQSPHLRCAVNPKGPCEGCDHYCA